MNTNFCCETSNETQLLARIWNERLGKLIKKNLRKNSKKPLGWAIKQMSAGG